MPDMGCALSDVKTVKLEEKDLFAVEGRKGWDKSMEARCDFSRHVRMTRRSGLFFLTIWKKTLMGRTLTEIKADDTMVDVFAKEVAQLIQDVIGAHLDKGQWCIITTPKRRHLTRNFATRIAVEIAAILDIPFYEDACSCRTKQRVDAIFDVNIVPDQPNVICFDDFVTTGQTLASMKKAMEPYHKNMIFFAGINNKL